MTIAEAAEKIRELETFFTDQSARAAAEAKRLSEVPGSEAAAGEGWNARDADDFRKAATFLGYARDRIGY